MRILVQLRGGEIQSVDVERAGGMAGSINAASAEVIIWDHDCPNISMSALEQALEVGCISTFSFDALLGTLRAKAEGGGS